MNMESKRHADFAYDRLIEMIAAGKLKPGTRLPTVPLAEEMGISRTPVIEALKRMQGEGIVVFKTSNGAWLADPTKKEIGDVYFVRATLEGLALELGFPFITPMVLIELKRHAELEKEYYATGDRVKFLKAGLDFHRELAECCPNRYLATCINSSLATTFAYVLLLEFRNENNKGAKRSAPAHKDLMDAIIAGDKAGAVKMVQESLMEAFRCTFEDMPD